MELLKHYNQLRENSSINCTTSLLLVRFANNGGVLEAKDFEVIFTSIESGDFEAGGYKWILRLYPNGDLKKNVVDHISFYLVISGSAYFQDGWELNAFFRLFLLDQIKGTYLVLEDANKKVKCFHGKMLYSGFDQFIPLESFVDPSNGYLIDDTCVFGAEVFVSEKSRIVREDCLSMIKNPVMYQHAWKIEKFSELKSGYYSEAFKAGDYKWKILIYPKGYGLGKGSHLSLDLEWSNPKTLPPGSGIFAAYCVRIWRQRSLYTELLKLFNQLIFVNKGSLLEAKYILLFILKNSSLVNFTAMATLNIDQDGILRSFSQSLQTHYTMKIQSFSSLNKNYVDSIESGEFEAGGHKWKLRLYPNGNLKKNVVDHISLYLFQIVLLDQNNGTYLVLEDANKKV
ncbi:hypothetical protein L3X38_001996 [Prunus dulcis]|uniref:MATH domain-containing protein n=1 Tax=Prunus dulcis TaxID=3755 RepID=A0AAD4WT60_PRUDU|nr:hypothetical protein L3X38_001996 [Prunus dulcis]